MLSAVRTGLGLDVGPGDVLRSLGKSLPGWVPPAADATAFEAEILEKLDVPKEIVMRHASPHFLHVFGTGQIRPGRIEVKQRRSRGIARPIRPAAPRQGGRPPEKTGFAGRNGVFAARGSLKHR